MSVKVVFPGHSGSAPLLHHPRLCADLKGVEGPLAQVVGVQQLQLVEQLDEEVGRDSFWEMSVATSE